MKLTELIDMNKIELTREELTTILQVATGNVKDFVMDNDKFIDEQLKAINYTRCCESVKDKHIPTIEVNLNSKQAQKDRCDQMTKILTAPSKAYYFNGTNYIEIEL